MSKNLKASASRPVDLPLAAGLSVIGVILLAGTSANAQASRLQAELIVQSTSGSQDLKEQNTGFIHSTSPLDLSFTTSAASGGATATSTATVSAFYGSLDVSGSGSVTSPSTSGGDASVGPFVGADPLVQFEDELFVGSSTLSVGTVVDLTFSETFSSQAMFSNDPAGDTSSAFIQSKFFVHDLHNDTGAFSFIDGVGVFDNTHIMQVQIGDTLDITGQLFARGEAATLHGGGASSFSFSDPMNLNIDALTDGVTLTSDSGHDYATTAGPGVPEPATWALMLAGFLGAGAALRRRAQAA